jgi:hypothetical protein
MAGKLIVRMTADKRFLKPSCTRSSTGSPNAIVCRWCSEGGHTLPVLLLGLRLSFGDPSPQLVRTLLNPPAHLLDCIDCVDQFPGNHLSERFVELPGERPARAAPRMNMPDSNFGAGLP